MDIMKFLFNLGKVFNWMQKISESKYFTSKDKWETLLTVLQNKKCITNVYDKIKRNKKKVA